MTGSVLPPNSSNPTSEAISPGVGVAPEQEGLFLQRGGEELSLEKVDDRFTLRPVTNRSLDALLQQIGAISTQSLPSVALVEVQVPPSQLNTAMQIARQSEQVVFASHVYRLQNSPNTRVYLTDEITVQFAPQVTQAEAEAIATSLGLQLLQPLVGVPQTFIFRVMGTAPANPIKLANQLMRRSDVIVAEPNIAIHTQSFYRPRDPDYPKQWYLNHAGGPDLATGSHISAEAAWDITRGVRSVVVAVADDGFDLNHPDFQGKGKIVAPKDLKQNEYLPLPETPEENHGTACAGVAIAEENNQGIVGVAPGCGFMPIRTTGFLDDRAIENIFNWAVDHGASVISCSWGASSIYHSLSLRQRAVITRAATQGRNGKGCVIVFAAGNSNRPVNGTIQEQGWKNNVISGQTAWLSGFAVHPDVITVAACTSLGKKSAYSNWGANISVCAPSNNAPPGIWLQEAGYVETGPSLRTALPGKGVFTSDRLGSAGYEAGNFTSGFGGTSSACPVVAGVAALMLSINPDLTAQEVKQLLQENTDKIVDADPDPQLGFRRGTYDASGHSQWFGYGKVNAFKAVKAAQQRILRPSPTRRIQQQNTTALPIPDFNLQGILSLLQVNDASLIRDVQIAVTVEHSFLGDLEIYILPPRGDAILLQGRTLGRLTRLQMTYSLDSTPFLRRLLGQPASGRWQLQVIDYAQLNTGTLKQWQLTLGI